MASVDPGPLHPHCIPSGCKLPPPLGQCSQPTVLKGLPDSPAAPDTLPKAVQATECCPHQDASQRPRLRGRGPGGSEMPQGHGSGPEGHGLAPCVILHPS